MYARYIPPPKAGGKPKQAPPAPPPLPSPIAPPSSSATPYARYVPPSKNHLTAAAIPPPELVPAKIVFSYDENNDKHPTPKKRKLDTSADDPTPENPRKKSKKAKKDEAGEVKEKKRKSKKDKDLDEETAVVKKEKKAKKEKKRKEAQEFAFNFEEGAEPSADGPKDDEPTVDEAPIEDAEINNAKESSIPVRPKREKKGRQDDEVAPRHKALLEKAAKSIKKANKESKEAEDGDSDQEAEPVEVHGLEPLPQPARVAPNTARPTYETLPPWMANPTRVTPDTKSSFTNLGLSSEVATNLESKGYKEAFAVQTAVIPLLLPSPDRQGDVVVSAATGSGKTLAYVLPMVRDVSQGVITRLRGLIVVPTRELVNQAKEACEMCANVFSGPERKTVKIGISMGNKQFKQEQADLMEMRQCYDPAGYQKDLRKRRRMGLGGVGGDSGEDEDSDEDYDNMFEDRPRPLPDHVVEYVSKVDILICTPGRLVEHIKSTPGFSLDYVRWLVVDEADKLLAQSFQDWLDVVMAKLSTENKPGDRAFPDSNKTGVRKVVLSATMTRDLSLLNGLKLGRPKLITLEKTKTDDVVDDAENKMEHVLPELLKESAIKIREPDQKALYLVDLLNSERMVPVSSAGIDVEMADAQEENTAGEPESSSEEDTSSDGDEDDEDGSSSVVKPKPNARSFRTTVLIFTKSNVTASRLSHLISILSPHLRSLIGTLTSETQTSERRKTLRAFAAGKIRILVASDLASRGLDLSDLEHVVNYDMPTSVESYVHRVGRTARAGKGGHAWTLFTKTEAGWFWTAIAGQGVSKSKGQQSGGIVRTDKVETVVVTKERYTPERVDEFEKALESLEGEVKTKKGRKKD